ncbi:MAG TPA: VCBS repeat-containing protein [Myxococcota bacterium]|nr:VCBS repeat-containing protein [Myxococcota bacterium]
MRLRTASGDPSDLLRHCERVLVAAGRAAGAGSRQQLRAAARRFVRRHRSDRSYLEWVLRCASASAALAVALLGLGAEPSSAKATLFRVAPSNPFNGIDVGGFSTIAAGDLDGDGDPDFVASEEFGSGAIHYFQNTGTALVPSVVERTGTANPFNGLSAGATPRLALGDIDHDGDLDLVSGENYGNSLRYYENTGTPIAPAFVERTGTRNPFAAVVAGRSAPALGDLDHDGDLDLVVADFYGVFRYFQNTGDAVHPAFVERTGSGNPLDGFDVGSFATAALGDLDGDGDLDLLAGDEPTGTFHYLENTGNPRAPAFRVRTGWDNPLHGETPGADSTPALVDLDGDHDLDLVSGNLNGTFVSYQNLQGSGIARTGAANPFDFFTMPDARVGLPALGDLDGDGDLDAVVGVAYGIQTGTFLYLENTGSADSPAFVQRTGSANPLDGLGVGFVATPTLGDLDGDGDLDLVSGEYHGTLLYFENTGTPTSPSFLQRTGTANPLNGKNAGQQSAPALADLDGDGDLDVVCGHYGAINTRFAYYENTGSASTPAFVERTGSANPLDFFVVDDVWLLPALGDADGDGDLDLLSPLGPIFDAYLENTGSARAPAFVAGASDPFAGTPMGPMTFGDLDGDGDLDVIRATGAGKLQLLENAIVARSPRYFGPTPLPFPGVDIGGFSSPAAGDLDGDGDPDFVASESFSDGKLHYFENTGDAMRPSVVEITGTANPFDSLNAGFTPRLALGDIDDDGDLDLISGENYGNPVHFFQNTGTPTAPDFVERTGTANPFNGVIVGRGSPALGDLDHDGDLDLVVGEFGGTFHYFQNTGNATTPHYVERTGTANPLNGLSAGNFATPALADVDRDGDLDLVSGEESPGIFHYFENTGSATAPAFVERTGTANPLDGKSVGLDSSPTFVDLEGDGDFDLVSGDRDGTFTTYYLPEPSASAMLGAGAGLLGWLARWRKRRRRSD